MLGLIELKSLNDEQSRRIAVAPAPSLGGIYIIVLHRYPQATILGYIQPNRAIVTKREYAKGFHTWDDAYRFMIIIENFLAHDTYCTIIQR